MSEQKSWKRQGLVVNFRGSLLAKLIGQANLSAARQRLHGSGPGGRDKTIGKSLEPVRDTAKNPRHKATGP